MAITFVGSEEGSVTNGGTPSVTLSGISLAENDVVVAFCVTTGGTQATPSGWTHISNRTILSDLHWLLCYKVMTASPDSSVSFWDSGGTGDSGTAVAAAFRGVDTSSPLDIAFDEAIHREESPSTFPPTPAITPVNDNCCIVVCGGSNHQEGSGNVTITNYSTAEFNVSNDSRDTTIAIAYRILTGGGGSSEAPDSWVGWDNVGGVSIGTVLALRPLGAGGQPFYSRDIIRIPSGGISII